MTARLLADAVTVLHLLFIVFASAGALLVLRWLAVAWLHLPALAWAVYVEASGRICPLTPLEQSLRMAAGQQGYAGSFVDHYIVPLVYPPGLTRGWQWAIAAALVVFNVALYARIAMRARRGRNAG
jgi:hypothetical protein